MQHEPPWFAVLSQVAAEPRDRAQRVTNRGPRGELSADRRGAEDLNLPRCQRDRGADLWAFPCEMPHQEQLPGNRGEQRQGHQQRIEALQLPFLGTRSRSSSI